MNKNVANIIEILGLRNVIIYIIAINIITFFAMFIDKKKAQHGSYRISEKTLFTLVLLGGGIGGIAGMYIFRHKTQKTKFVVGFPAILIFEIIVSIYFIFFNWLPSLR